MTLERLERQTLENTYSRLDLSTPQHAHLVVRCLRSGEESVIKCIRMLNSSSRIGQGETLARRTRYPPGSGESTPDTAHVSGVIAQRLSFNGLGCFAS